MMWELISNGKIREFVAILHEAPEMIQLAAIAVKAGLTKGQWDATCAVHPNMAGELVTLKEKQQPGAMSAG